jgi:lipid-binding SYLF domain-containing protein
MYKRIKLIFILVMAFTMAGFSQENDVDKAREAIKDFKKEDPGIGKLFESSYGYAVLPAIGKGGIGIGGAGGKGTVFRGGEPVADVKMSQVTVGLQLGGQKYAEVIFFEDEEAYTRFVEKDFEFAAQVSAVALASGASADAKFKDGMLIFTQALGGLMYEASIGGQRFKVEMY